MASAASGTASTSESHTRLLEASDDDYGQLYIVSEDEDKHNYYNFSCDSDVPGPAPEVEPPRPAPKDHHFYYEQQQPRPQQPDLNDNHQDNQPQNYWLGSQLSAQQQTQQQTTANLLPTAPSIVTSNCNGGPPQASTFVNGLSYNCYYTNNGLVDPNTSYHVSF